MPRGRPRKYPKVEAEGEEMVNGIDGDTSEPVTDEKNTETLSVSPASTETEEKETTETLREIKIREAGKLGAGQKYFEAPDGTILIGEEDSERLLYRAGNMWINPMR